MAFVPVWLELIALFVALPAILSAPLPLPLRATAVIGALVYITVLSIRKKLISRDLFRFSGTEPAQWYGIFGRFAAFVVASTIAVAVWNRELLFSVVRSDPLLWLTMLVVYCLFSVLPQVLLFRVFFFARYMHLFRSRGIAVLASAVLFAWAHIVIAHPIVFLLTFFGGLIFSRTYLASRSASVATIEHALYGFWLFTVGLGPIFAFPG
ncbi:MAG: CPBP family intramembrane metalloprotease [Spirochaeta sp.]|jgi:membrane protease YdiL (CAAX protease family)|nr:CPBP family intramembrane metalloprotease [Spirochaeta sp.]